MRSYLPFRPLWFLFAIFPFVGTALWAQPSEQPQPAADALPLNERLADSCEELTSRCQSMEFDCVWTSTVTMTASGEKDDPQIVQQTGKLDIPHHRFTFTTSPLDDSSPKKDAQEKETSSKDAKSNDSHGEEHKSTVRTQVDNKFMLLSQSGKEIQFTECSQNFLDPSAPPDKFEKWPECLLFFEYLSILTGYYDIAGQQTFLPDLLRSSEVKAEDTGGDSEGNIFTVETDQEVIRLTRGSAEPALLDRIEITKKNDVPPAYAKRTTCTVASRNSDGVPVDYTVTQVLPGGEIHGLTYQPREISTRVEVKQIKGNAAFNDKDFGFPNKVPDGTKALVHNVPQIDYIWYKGQIVPKTDELMLTIAKGGNKFTPGMIKFKVLLISGGIVLLLIAGAWRLLTYWNHNSKA